MVQRQAVDELVDRKNQMIAALYSNPTWDEEDNDRPGTLKNIENSFNRAIEAIYHPELVKPKEEEIDWDNPFWSAAKRNLDRLNTPRDTGSATVGEVTKVEEQYEQRVKRANEMIKQIDQT